MSSTVLKLQLLIRAELATSQIRARRAATRSGLFLVAMVFGLLGLGLANLAGFFYLATLMSNAAAASVMALINIVAAGLIAMLASRAGPSENEEKLAQQMRDMAYAELSSDLEKVTGEIAEVAADVRRIRTGLSSIADGAAASIASLLGVLAKAVKSE